MINIDWSKLSRNFEENPLVYYNPHKRESLSYEDLLYLVENFSFCDIKSILGVSDNYLRRQLNIHNLKTKIDHRRKYPKQTKEEKEIAKYGALNLTHKEKINITYTKNPELKVKQIETWKSNWKNRTENDEKIRQAKTKQTKIIRYNDENFNNQKQRQETNLKKYGYITPLIQRQVLSKSHDEEHVKRQSIYMTEKWSNITKEDREKFFLNIKKRNLIKTGYESHMRNPVWLNRRKDLSIKNNLPEDLTNCEVLQILRRKSMRENGTTNTSYGFEDKMIKYLRTKYPNYTIIQSYFEDPRYPYECDCYVKELDLFIEFQGSYFHNWRPFNNSSEHIKEYEEMIINDGQSATIADTWRYRDVEKRRIAKENNLNYLEYWEKLILLPEDIKGNKNNLILYYQQDLFYRDNQLELFDPIDRWHYYQNAVKHSDFYKKYKYVSHYALLRRPYISKQIGYSSFNIKLCEIVDEKYSVYDPCGGWGHRLLGFKNHKQYIYNDINNQTELNCRKMASDLNISNVKFYNQDAALPIQDEYDIVFTCPPYFNKEIFTEEGAENYTEEEFINWWNNVLDNLHPLTGEIYIVINSSYLKYFTSNNYTYEIVKTTDRRSHYHKNTKIAEEIVVKFTKVEN